MRLWIPIYPPFGQTTGDGAGSIPAAVRRGIRGRYENRCAFCGEAEYSDAELDSRVQPKLSCAHLAPRAGYFHTGFANKFDVNSMRNFILLCGSHGRKGTCHDGFDSHKLALIPDILGQVQGWKLLNAYSEWKAGDQGNSGLQLRTVTFRQVRSRHGLQACPCNPIAQVRFGKPSRAQRGPRCGRHDWRCERPLND